MSRRVSRRVVLGSRHRRGPVRDRLDHRPRRRRQHRHAARTRPRQPRRPSRPARPVERAGPLRAGRSAGRARRPRSVADRLRAGPPRRRRAGRRHPRPDAAARRRHRHLHRGRRGHRRDGAARDRRRQPDHHRQRRHRGAAQHAHRGSDARRADARRRRRQRRLSQRLLDPRRAVRSLERDAGRHPQLAARAHRPPRPRHRLPGDAEQRHPRGRLGPVRQLPAALRQPHRVAGRLPDARGVAGPPPDARRAERHRGIGGGGRPDRKRPPRLVARHRAQELHRLADPPPRSGDDRHLRLRRRPGQGRLRRDAAPYRHRHDGRRPVALGRGQRRRRPELSRRRPQPDRDDGADAALRGRQERGRHAAGLRRLQPIPQPDAVGTAAQHRHRARRVVPGHDGGAGAARIDDRRRRPPAMAGRLARRVPATSPPGSGSRAAARSGGRGKAPTSRRGCSRIAP